LESKNIIRSPSPVSLQYSLAIIAEYHHCEISSLRNIVIAKYCHCKISSLRNIIIAKHHPGRNPLANPPLSDFSFRHWIIYFPKSGIWKNVNISKFSQTGRKIILTISSNPEQFARFFFILMFLLQYFLIYFAKKFSELSFNYISIW